MMNSTFLRKIRLLAALVALAVVGTFSLLEGYYYFNDFDSNTTDWVLLYKYSRNGYINNGDSPTPTAAMTRTGSELQFTGTVNSSSTYMDMWTGRAAYYNGATYSASATAPFGVEFRRTHARIDPQTGSNGESERHSAAQGFWLVQGTPPTGSIANETFANSIFMYDMMRMCYNLDGSNKPYSTWGSYVASAQRFDLTQAKKNDGTPVNIINDATYTLEWSYDDAYGAGSQEPGPPSGTDNADNNNNNPVTVRLTHNGSRVNFFINPNPTSVVGHPYPNEFLLVGGEDIAWNSGMRFMTGMETRRADGEAHEAYLDHVLVRSVAESVTAEISPDKVAKGSVNNFQIAISPTLISDNAGIGELTIVKPAAYAAAWTPASIQVFGNYGTGTNHAVLAGLKKMNVVTGGAPSVAGDAYVFIDPTDSANLRIRFRQTSDAANDVIQSGLSVDQRKIVVVVPFTAPADANGSGETFAVYADCVKYDGQAYGKWGTTGRIQALAGDAAAAWSGNSLAVKTYNNPDARATMAPVETYVGAASLSLYIATTNANSPDISELRIAIPTNFTPAVGNAGGLNYNSLLIADDENNVQLEKIGDTNFIRVRYGNEGALAAAGGMDKITLTMASTPYGFVGATKNTAWSAKVYSTIAGTVATATRIDDAYPSMNVLVRQLPPSVTASVSTPYEGSANVLYNNVHINQVTFTVQNNGGIGNHVKRLQIRFPSEITGAQCVSSSVIGSATGSYDATFRYLTIDYAANGKTLAPGASDTLVVNIQDGVATMSDRTTADCQVFADNDNGESYKIATEASQTWGLIWQRPNAAGNASLTLANGLALGTTNRIYASSYTTTLNMVINNTAGSDNDIKLVEITVPAQFTNISELMSSVVGATTFEQASGNRILVRYHNDGKAIVNTASDTIRMKLVDSVPYDGAQEVSFAVRVGNTAYESNLQATGALGTGNKKISFVPPPLLASAATTPAMINSDSTVNVLTTVIRNTGEVDNIIRELRIYVPNTIATEILDTATSSILGTDSGSSSDFNVYATAESNYLRIVYPAGKPFKGGMTETIAFSLVDHVNTTMSLRVDVVASNVQGVMQVLPVTSGGSDTISIRLPPPQATFGLAPAVLFRRESGAGATTNVIALDLTNTGSGGNSITNVIINFPEIIQYKNIETAGQSNSRGVPMLLDEVNKKVRLNFSAAPLVAGTGVRVWLAVRNGVTVQSVSNAFTCAVVNDVESGQAVARTGRATSLSFVKQPEAGMAQGDATPNQIFTTDSQSTFAFSLKNGLDGGVPVKRLRITLPVPFVTTDSVIASPWPSSTEIVTATNGQNAFVNYTISPLAGGSEDIVTLKLKDNLVSGEASVAFDAAVDYGDGAGFHPVATASGASLGMQFVFPDASAFAAVSPRQINMNTVSNQLVVTVTNTGVAGNHIKMIEIDFGKFVTNVGVRSSAILGAGAGTIISNRYLLLNYEAAATNLPSSRKDTITAAVYDNIGEITNVTVSVRVANTTSSAQYRAAGAQTTGAFVVNYFRPDYLASAYIEPLNRISEAKPWSIWSTVTTSTLRFNIVNDGAAGNDLDIVRLYVPTIFFDPATIAYGTSQRGGTFGVAGNLVTVTYGAGLRLEATERDVIQFAINDRVVSTNAFSSWLSTARFTTSGTTFLTNNTVAGRTNAIAFEMPAPVGSARLVQKSVFTTTRRLLTALDVTNAGSGSNALTRVRITIPAGLQGGLATAQAAGTLGTFVTNSFATMKSYAGGVLTLDYDNFPVGKNDRIWLALSNATTEATTADFQVQLDNGVVQAAATPWTASALTFAVSTPPSAYVEVVSPRDGIVNRLWSTDYDAQYRVHVRNDGTGDNAVRRVRVTLPAGFMIKNATSAAVGTLGRFLVADSNVVMFDYNLTPFAFSASQADAILIQAVDPWNAGSASTNFTVQVGELDTVALNTNYAATRIYNGNTCTVDFVHPPVTGEFWIDGFGSGIKPSMYVAEKLKTSATNLTIKIKNQGVASNTIAGLRIDLPSVFTTISPASPSALGGTVTTSGSAIFVSYAGAKLAAGATDTITFTAGHAQTDATNNLLFALLADNGDGKGSVALAAPTEGFATLDIKYPPIEVFAGIRDVTDIYTINTNASLTYLVKNRAQGYNIYRTVLTNIDLSLFDTVTATSSRGGTVTVDKAKGTIGIDYATGQELAFNGVDTIAIGLRYAIADSVTRTLTFNNVAFLTNGVLVSATNRQARALDIIDTDTSRSENQSLTLGPAPFGVLYGSILPVFKTDKTAAGSFLPNIVKVEIVGLATTAVVTTPYHREVGSDGTLQNAALVAYSDPSQGGSFTISYVPEGSYRLRLSAENFRLTLTNVAAVANRKQAVATVALKNDYLDPNVQNAQLVVDYADTNTSFTLPGGDLLDQFSLDISVVDMTADQENNVLRNNLMKTLSDTSLLGCFRFDIRDRLGASVSGVGIGGDGIIKLHYTATNLNLPLASGTWAEDNLAVWYWKETTTEWVPVGGVVNKTLQTVSAKINYLHNYYAVASVRPEAAAKAIYNVKASPNPFTPGRGGDNSAKLKLTFSFADVHETYTVTIYNMRGQKVREFKRDGSYKQGEVFWDGTHENGFGLPGGVYLYQVRAGSQTFSGSVLLLK